METYRQIVDNNITTVFSNDSYDIIDNYSNGLSSANINYRENNDNLISIKLLKDLLKTNHQIDNIIIVINELASREVISMEVRNYIFECIGIVNLNEEKVKSYKS